MSPPSVSIRLTNEFSRVVNTSGGGGKIVALSFTTVIELDGGSVCGFTMRLPFASLATGACVFFGGLAFMVAVCFFSTTGLGTVEGTAFAVVVTTVGILTHSRKVISSTAKSFPQLQKP